MKSKEAKEFIDGCMDHLTVEMTDHAGYRAADAAKSGRGIQVLLRIQGRLWRDRQGLPPCTV